VAARRRTVLTLEIDLDAEPMSGVLRDGEGRGSAFAGWMELALALELRLGEARGEEPPSASVQQAP
jgi:hypothetical protein